MYGSPARGAGAKKRTFNYKLLRKPHISPFKIHHTIENALRMKTLRMKELKSSVGLGGKPGDGGEEVNKDAIIGSLTSLSYFSTSIV